MPAPALKLFDAYVASERQGAVLFASAGLVLGMAVWSLATGAQASGTSGPAPMYPSSAPAISIVAVPNLSVLQVIDTLPMTSRFDMLLYNASVRDELMGEGPYTVFAPADNYFDYLPKGAYASLTRAQERELAEHLVVPDDAIGTHDANSGQYITLAQDELPIEIQNGVVRVGPAASGGFAIRAYRAKNGIVYVINKVLAPNDLVAVLGGE